MKYTHLLFFLSLVLCIISCQNDGDQNNAVQSKVQGNITNNKATIKVASFEKLPPERTGINFTNRIKETQNLNIYNFEYFYNGAGVSVGDVNNDGLPDLYFSCNQCPNKLYINKGNLQFENITKTSGIEARGKFKTGTAMVDINNDGLLDIFALRSGKDELVDRRNYVFINNGDLTFQNKSSTLGIDAPTNTMHVNFLDFDRDGDIDVFYGNHPLDLFTNNQLKVKKRPGGGFEINNIASNQEEAQKLYRNDNGKFVNIAESAGIGKRGFALSSIVSDFNDDGYPDLYIGNDYIDPDNLYINQKNGKFKDERAKYFKVMSQNTMGTDYEDVNNDGLPDLIATDMLASTRQRQQELGTNMFRDYFDQSVAYGYGAQIFKNTLQINQGNGSYSDQSYLRGVHATDWTWASLLADFNNDGSKDLYVTNGFRRDISDLDFMDFRDANQGVAIDVDNIQELMELIPSKKVSNQFFVNNGQGQFSDLTKEANLNDPGFSHGAVYADLDNDGDLELIVNNLDEPASIYKNNTRETDPSNSNFLSVRLQGPNGNRFGIGAKVYVHAGADVMMQEYRPMKGYMSCVENRLHFGLGSKNQVDKLIIEWPDGRTETIQKIEANQHFIAQYSNAKGRKQKTTLPSPLFEKAKIPGLVYKHKDLKFNDFNREPLLMHKYSDSGPAFAIGDLNGDGLDDYYIGGAKNSKGSVTLQLQQGGFGSKKTINSKDDAKYEDVDATFFDADGDGDLDLFVVSGGSENDRGSNLFADRLYLNDGKGSFALSKNIPAITENGSCVSAGDYDGDGDMDLFVGAGVVPGRFPEGGVSRILENNDGLFTDKTESLFKEKSLGIVSSSQWVDLNGDKKLELIISGEWMPIRVFGLEGNEMVEMTKQFGLEGTNGLWQSLKVIDIDNDGDQDIIAGNYGLNTRYRASSKDPLTCYGGDLDNNDFLDPIICEVSNGKSYPLARKVVLSSTLPMIKKKALKNVDYAKASMDEIFDESVLKDVPIYEVNELETCIFINNGSQFEKQQLPLEAQSFPVCAIEYDASNKSLFLAGNIDGMEVINGPNNAGNGLMLQKQGKNWKPLLPLESGISIPYSTRALKLLNTKKHGKLLIAANHNGPLQAFAQN